MFGHQPPKGRPPSRLKAIVDTGKPVKAHPTRFVDEPVPVLVDLGAVFPLPVFYAGVPVPGGLQLRRVVEGRLTMWAMAEEGDWLGFVAYDVHGADEGGLPQRVSHWVPGEVLKLRDD